MTIGKHEVGPGRPAFMVAEMSCNHGHSYETAVETVRAMAKAGADAVKLQTDNPDGGITVDSDRPEFRIRSGPWAGKTLYQLYQETYTPWDWVPRLTEVANALGMECFSTPSCLEGVKYLESVGVPCYKVSSFEITDERLIRAIAATGKPCFISLGCADVFEKLCAQEAFGTEWWKRLTFLDCVSEYPADPADFNLTRGMTGISDHSLGHSITWAAVALGAYVVERHFILSRAMGGPDSGFSLEPDEFAHMVREVRNIEAAMRPKQRHVSREFCKSLFIARDMEEGEELKEEDILVIRPGNGMHPRLLSQVVGRKLSQKVSKHAPLTMAVIA